MAKNLTQVMLARFAGGILHGSIIIRGIVIHILENFLITVLSVTKVTAIGVVWERTRPKFMV